ncbi:InlB B-repeat-containing protein [Candidatus Saccharibacteria bacterium]|nr:InlB B-repeat-containing protein [Candidatus Saccharibacteria bacterium]
MQLSYKCNKFRILAAVLAVLMLVFGCLSARQDIDAAPMPPAIGAVNATVNNEIDLVAAINNAPTNGNQYVIAVSGTVELTARLNIPTGTNIALTGGGTLSGMATFDTTGEVYVAGHLLLGNITITHDTNVLGRGIFIPAGGHLDMLSGANITGNSYNSTASTGGYGIGAGVALVNNATFDMWSGTISNNHATGTGVAGDGGGVFVGQGTGSVFTMYGGSITNNTGIVGSAVFFGLTGGNFTMNGGSITNNIGTGEGTIGMYGANAIFTMNGGSITHNTSDNGGGVSVLDGQDGTKTFTMNGGIIANNTVTNVGGAVEISPGGGVGATETFTMNDGVIANNTALNGGGIGLNPAGGSFTAHAPIITLAGGTINGNAATNSGGGIYAVGGTINQGREIDTINIAGTNILNNSAVNGGGVYNAIYSQLNITDGTISGNTASTDGGGVYTVDYTTLSVDAGVVFADNSAATASTRDAADDVVYSAQIAATDWTEPFTQGYNNFDINYVLGVPQQVVWFNTKGGSTITPVVVGNGASVTQPADPTRSGYIFVGWFDSNLMDEYDFDSPVTDNLTLSAKWAAVPKIPNTGYATVANDAIIPTTNIAL